MLIYEDFIPFEEIKPPASKPPKSKATKVVRGFLVNKNAFSIGVTRLSPLDIIKQAAKYGISVDHLFQTDSLTAALFRQMENFGESADALESMSFREFIRRAEFHGLLGSHRIGSIDVRADLFWSVEDDAPLVVMYLVPRDRKQPPWLHRIFNAEWAVFESGLSVSPQDIERVKAIRYKPTAPETDKAPTRTGQWRLTMLREDGQLGRVNFRSMRLPYESREQVREKSKMLQRSASRKQNKSLARTKQSMPA